MTCMPRLTVSAARAILPELLDRVERGEKITITRHGRDAAVLLRPDAVRTEAPRPCLGVLPLQEPSCWAAPH